MILTLFVCPKCGRATLWNPSRGEYESPMCLMDGSAQSLVHNVELHVLPAGEAIPERAQNLIAPQGDANDQPILSLEDRLLVALAGRGAQRIGEFLANAFQDGLLAFWDASDEALVEAVEGQGDALGLHAPEARERVADDGADSARSKAVE